MNVYYNENDPKAAAWLRELILAGELPEGYIDTRSIEDVRPSDLIGYTQCHFFAGIGGWSYALRLAGWPGDRPVWTGSCPCQPFSTAGKGLGEKDPRHLWPAWFRLIKAVRPPVIFGEQAASKGGRAWLAGARDDLRSVGYEVAAADLPASSVGAPHIRQRLWLVADDGDGAVAGNEEIGDEPSRPNDFHPHESLGSIEMGAGIQAQVEGVGNGVGTTDTGTASVGAPHIRQRLWWVADARCDESWERRVAGCEESTGKQSGTGPRLGSSDGGLAHTTRQQSYGGGCERPERRGEYSDGSSDGGLGDPSSAGAGRDGGAIPRSEAERERGGIVTWGFRDGALDAGSVCWVPCCDGKARRIEPGIEPLVDGLPGRVGLLRGYGNAIVPQCAAEFIVAYMEAQ